METPFEHKISTITLTTQLPNCQLNLFNIGKYLEVDQDILGIKHTCSGVPVTKGLYATTIYKKAKSKDITKVNKTLFYNQISIIVNNNGNNVNVKIFGNGSLHMTGCKNVDEGVVITKLLYNKLQNLSQRRENVLITKDVNGVLLDKDNMIYSYDSQQVIGYLKQNSMLYDPASTSYIIHKRECSYDARSKMLISTKTEIKRTRPIFNLSGEQIGFAQLELLKNKTKFYKKNSNIYHDISTGLIYYDNNIVIGKIHYNYDLTKVTNQDKMPDVYELNYHCNPFLTSSYHIEESNFTRDNLNLDVNCINLYFNMGFEINRQRLFDKLVAKRFICKYKPESYSGIKYVFKYPQQGTATACLPGLCPCNNKCTCTNITFLIFQSGNVIVTGFRSENQIHIVKQSFIDMITDWKETIIKKTLPNIGIVN